MIDEFDRFNAGLTENNLLIVDSLNFAFRFKHRGSTSFASVFVRDINSFARSFSAETVYVLGDGGSRFRKAVYPEYKGNRKIYDEDEKLNFEIFLEEYNKGLELIQHPVIKFRGVEADDIMALIVEENYEKYDRIYLLSTDHDWDLLLKDNVIRFAYTTKKEFRLDNYEELVGYPQEHHLSVKVLQGDKSDNIVGITGIGIKRASNLVKEYGSTLNILSSMPLKGKAKYIQNLNDGKDQILLNYKLMNLPATYQEALGDEIADEVRKIINES